ncbi:hypothetical protein OUZ56_021684 [Daphnia magna]|uniref:Uncharacterized protein n=1 Tax=Daphnia magna TaxID=35525 RepID=A0ABR0AUA5_9CRUS|nr:hypothetical protein OUZ56_021684 [Daphnia magna]
MESLYFTTVGQLKKQIDFDDYIGITDNISTSKTTIQKTKSIFQEAKLNMRSWVTNDQAVRKFLKTGRHHNRIGGPSDQKKYPKDISKNIRSHWVLSTHYAPTENNLPEAFGC